MSLTIAVSAQQKKIIPKKGEVVFTSENIILDEVLFNATMKGIQQKMINHLRAKLELEGNQKIDTTLLQQFISTNIMADYMVQQKHKNSHHVYENRFIKSFESADETIPHSFSYINQDSSNYVRRQVLDGDTSETEATAFEYQKNRDITIKEFKQEQKIINGFKCFKVTYQYKEDFDGDEELGAILTTNEYSTTEFWVTTDIQSLFHPVCRIKEILVKYYPLEISQQSSLAKGFKIIHRLKNITLSN
ncbi:hypothetical protein FA048_05860 [Pedobacter polaris]|uniref:Uncharacterized protein n=1 Tax=Pedobacter polaris TaxID=2571273 RepID=A0A4U1CV35_9SPHI|nr:hypothetical protein [Pedobacter polaris]TKC13137.1 hypothetical protein FA048_05860 [Pedobacter polaris]